MTDVSYRIAWVQSMPHGRLSYGSTTRVWKDKKEVDRLVALFNVKDRRYFKHWVEEVTRDRKGSVP